MYQNTFILSVTLSTAFLDSFQSLMTTSTNTNSYTSSENITPTPNTNLLNLPTPIHQYPAITPLLLNNNISPPTIPEEVEWNPTSEFEEDDEGFNTDDCLDDDLDDLNELSQPSTASMTTNIRPIVSTSIPSLTAFTSATRRVRISSIYHFRPSTNRAWNTNTNINPRKKSMFYAKPFYQGKWHSRQLRLKNFGYRRHSFY